MVSRRRWAVQDQTKMFLEQLLPGDVLLTSERGLFLSGVFIKLANFFKRGSEYKDWTHSALYVGENYVVEAVPDKNVRIVNLVTTYPLERFQIMVLRHPNANTLKLSQVVSFCKKQVETGDKYNLWGLTYFLFYNFIPMQVHFLLDNDLVDKIFRIKNTYFCSELVSDGFKNAEIYCFEREPYKVMPVDFANDLIFQKIGTFGISIPNRKWLNGIYRLASFLMIGLTFVVTFLLAILFMVVWVGGSILPRKNMSNK
jgi:hypothetical protein